MCGRQNVWVVCLLFNLFLLFVYVHSFCHLPLFIDLWFHWWHRCSQFVLYFYMLFIPICFSPRLFCCTTSVWITLSSRLFEIFWFFLSKTLFVFDILNTLKHCPFVWKWLKKLFCYKCADLIPPVRSVGTK